MAKDTGLSDFANVQEEAQKEQAAKVLTRTKGGGPVRHSQLRFYDSENWERAHFFARSQGVSLNQLAVIGISKLMEERGLPGLNLEKEGGWRRSHPDPSTVTQ